jgi:hypothetical protein
MWRPSLLVALSCVPLTHLDPAATRIHGAPAPPAVFGRVIEQVTAVIGSGAFPDSRQIVSCQHINGGLRHHADDGVEIERSGFPTKVIFIALKPGILKCMHVFRLQHLQIFSGGRFIVGDRAKGAI